MAGYAPAPSNTTGKNLFHPCCLAVERDWEWSISNERYTVGMRAALTYWAFGLAAWASLFGVPAIANALGAQEPDGPLLIGLLGFCVFGYCAVRSRKHYDHQHHE